MIVTYDTEFLDDGSTIELISLGMVAADGRELYVVNADADYDRILDHDARREGWLRANVFRHLPNGGQDMGDGFEPEWELDYHDPVVQTRDRIAWLVEKFLRATPDVELWANYPATDHVALYQLWGPMIDCTKHGMPMRTNCLAQERSQYSRRQAARFPHMSTRELIEQRFIPAKPVQDPATEHHALWDARHDMDLARALGLIELSGIAP